MPFRDNRESGYTLKMTALYEAGSVLATPPAMTDRSWLHGPIMLCGDFMLASVAVCPGVKLFVGVPVVLARLGIL